MKVANLRGGIYVASELAEWMSRPNNRVTYTTNPIQSDAE